MRVELKDSFVEKLTDQVDYIAIDKPGAARKFKEELLTRIKNLRSSRLSVVSQSTSTILILET